MGLIIVRSEEIGIGVVVAVSDTVAWSSVIWDGEIGGFASVASFSVFVDWTKRSFVGACVEYFSFGTIVAVDSGLDSFAMVGVVAGGGGFVTCARGAGAGVGGVMGVSISIAS